jgi:hypothetical protein
MSQIDFNIEQIAHLDAFEIERQARIAQSRYIAAAMSSLLRSIASRLRRAPDAHAA